VVAIKICNKHNWDVYSNSPVSSYQVGLYDADFCSGKTSLRREIKHYTFDFSKLKYYICKMLIIIIV